MFYHKTLGFCLGPAWSCDHFFIYSRKKTLIFS